MPFAAIFRSTPVPVVLLAFSTLLAAPLPAAGGPTDSEDAPAGSHTVFMGLDLRVVRDQARCPVVNADADTVEFLTDESTARLPVNNADIKASFQPRVGRVRLEIANVHTQRIYSRERDPARESMRQQILMDSVRSQARESAEINARATVQGHGIAAAAAVRSGNSPSGFDAAAGGAIQDLNSTPDLFSAALPGEYATEDDTGAGGSFDAYEFACKISAPTDVDHAYGALVLNVRDPVNSRQVVQAVKFFSIRQLGPKARRITVIQEGLPIGFSIASYTVHIFSEGREFPTTLSKNAVSVSRDEAHQFLILQYLRENHQGTLPVAIIPELLPAGLASLLKPDQAQGTIDLKIDRDGLVTAVQEVRGIGTKISPEFSAALRDLRFFPALVAGTAVDGSGTFALSEIVR